MALYSPHCADVPLRNCSLAHSSSCCSSGNIRFVSTAERDSCVFLCGSDDPRRLCLLAAVHNWALSADLCAWPEVGGGPRSLHHCCVCQSRCLCQCFYLTFVLEWNRPSGAFRVLAEPHAVTPAFVLFQMDRDTIFLYSVMCEKTPIEYRYMCNTVIVAEIKNKLVRLE